MDIFPFFSGTVVICVSGIKPETLINRLRLKIPMRKITKTQKHALRFEIMCRHKREVLDCIAKVCPDASIQIEKETGFPVLANRLKKRFGLFVGGALAILLTVLSSQRIWYVSVEGNQSVDSETIKKQLLSLGIGEGLPKKTKDLEYLYNTFLLGEKRISWIAVNYDGMIAHVEVKEVEKPERQIDKSKITNLVASCDGIIERVDALDGSAAVFAGDTVCKGDLLVSAFMDTRETGTVLRTARGSVWASTIHTYEVSVPKQLTVKQYTGKKNVKRAIGILGQQIPLYVPVPCRMPLYEKTISQQPFVLFGRIHLPFSVQTEESKAYRINQVPISKEKAAEKAAAELVKRIESDLIKAEILKREDTMRETDTAYHFIYELSCIENIAVPVEMQFDERGAFTVSH